MALSSAVQGRREQEVRPGRVGWASKQRQHVHVCQTSGPGGDKRRCDKRGQRAGPRFTEVRDRKSTRLNSSHSQISYAVFCLKKKKSRPQPSNRNERVRRLALSRA